MKIPKTLRIGTTIKISYTPYIVVGQKDNIGPLVMSLSDNTRNVRAIPLGTEYSLLEIQELSTIVRIVERLELIAQTYPAINQTIQLVKNSKNKPLKKRWLWQQFRARSRGNTSLGIFRPLERARVFTHTRKDTH